MRRAIEEKSHMIGGEGGIGRAAQYPETNIAETWAKPMKGGRRALIHNLSEE